jgi:hypothetical protein
MYIICTTEEMYVPVVHKIFPSFLINVLLFPECLDGLIIIFAKSKLLTMFYKLPEYQLAVIIHSI